MTRRRLEILPDAAAVARRAAAIFTAAAGAAIAARGRFSVALSGGRTPQGLYQELAAGLHGPIDWRLAQVFFGDERPVPPDHPDSNVGMARELLLEKVQIPAGRLHPLHGDAPDPDAEALAYEEELARVLGASRGGPPPSLDLVLLGLGADGHTASLFPHTAALSEERRWVVANTVPALGAVRLTLTAPLLNAARDVLFLVTGKEKATALAAVLADEGDGTELPARLIDPPAGRLTWLVDEAAAQRLRAAAP